MKLQGVRGNAVPNPAKQGRDKQGANTCVSGGLKKNYVRKAILGAEKKQGEGEERRPPMKLLARPSRHA